MRRLAIATAMTLGLGLASLTVSAATMEEVSQTIAEAQIALDKADALGFRWRDSKKILNSAKKSANAGDLDAALPLAEQARFQGKAAQAQAEREANPGTRF